MIDENKDPQVSKIEFKETFAKAGESDWSIPAALVVGCLLIAGSIMYGSKQIANSFSQSGGSLGAPLVQGTTQTAGAQQQAAAPSVPTTGPVKVALRSDEPVLGNKNAKVTVIEFGDFQCPYCKSFFQQTFSDLKTKYIDTGKIAYIFRHFPLTQIHINAEISAQAAECANLQGKFWQFHDLLYTNGQSDGTGLDKASLEKYADSLGLNNGTFGFGKNKFNQCLEGNATKATVDADQAEGTKDGVNGTPSFFINGQLLVGAQPASAFEQAIEAALKQ